MKKIKFFVLAFALFVMFSGKSFALICNDSRSIGGSADDCWVSAQVASNETTLVSAGTVLVLDITNAQFNADNSAYQVRVGAASSNGVFVAGVAQRSITSGSTALILARGKGVVATNVTDTITSGNALFVGVSGNATITTSNTQTQLGVALENQTATSTPARSTVKSYITIV